jgi:hypothetical protein
MSTYLCGNRVRISKNNQDGGYRKKTKSIIYHFKKLKAMKNSKENVQIGSNVTPGLVIKIKGVLVTKNLHPVRGKDRLTNSRFEFQMKAIKMIRFMQPLADFMNQIKTKPFIGSSRLSTLLTHNIQYTKDYDPDLTLDYGQLIVSKGDLPNAPGISVSSPKDGRLVFRWTDNSGIGKARASDLFNFYLVSSQRAVKWRWFPTRPNSR